MTDESRLDDLAPTDAEAVTGAGTIPPPLLDGPDLPEFEVTTPTVDIDKHELQGEVRDQRDAAQRRVDKAVDKITPDRP